MLKSKLIITEDTFSNYLENLYKYVCNSKNHEPFLKDSAQDLHFNYIEPLMPKGNPNLMFSPLEKKHQVFSTNGNKSSLELIYTGFTEQARHGDLNFIMWQFGNPIEHELYRDYAVYQETGIDSVAPNFGGHHFVELGTRNFLNHFYYKVMGYTASVLQNNKVGTEAKVNRMDYIDSWINSFW